MDADNPSTSTSPPFPALPALRQGVRPCRPFRRVCSEVKGWPHVNVISRVCLDISCDDGDMTLMTLMTVNSEQRTDETRNKCTVTLTTMLTSPSLPARCGPCSLQCEGLQERLLHMSLHRPAASRSIYIYTLHPTELGIDFPQRAFANIDSDYHPATLMHEEFESMFVTCEYSLLKVHTLADTPRLRETPLISQPVRRAASPRL